MPTRHLQPSLAPATASDNGLKIAVIVACEPPCSYTRSRQGQGQAQFQVSTSNPTWSDENRTTAHPDHQSVTLSRSRQPRAICQEEDTQTAAPGAANADPSCKRSTLYCPPGSLQGGKVDDLAEATDLPMTHAATDPKGFTASRERAVRASASPRKPFTQKGATCLLKFR